MLRITEMPGGGVAGKSRPASFETVELAGVLDTGTELDQGAALVPLALASRLAPSPIVTP